MAFVSLQDGNGYKGKTAQTSTNESNSVRASLQCNITDLCF